MSGKVIPFRINVNPDRNEHASEWSPHNVQMPNNKEISAVIAGLAKDAGFDAFKPDGSINHNQLARDLKVHQSAVTRLLSGQIPKKRASLAKIAEGFGLSENEFVAMLDPTAASQPTPILPPEAHELWTLWIQLQRPVRNYFTEQIKSAVEFGEQFPELASALGDQAMRAAARTRVQRQRKARS